MYCHEHELHLDTCYTLNLGCKSVQTNLLLYMVAIKVKITALGMYCIILCNSSNGSQSKSKSSVSCSSCSSIMVIIGALVVVTGIAVVVAVFYLNA